MTWSTRLLPGIAPDGGPVISVLAKRTYLLRHGEIAVPDPGPQLPWVEADEYLGTGNPALEAVRVQSDLTAWKPGTDVAVIGKAHAPRGKQARFFDAGIQIGAFRKMVRVFGDRKIRPATLGFDFAEPEPFDSMPLHYGLAYGGRHKIGELETTYPRNPVGRGFAVRADIEDLAGLQLPNLENPAQLLTPQNLVLKSLDRWTEAPRPWALGYTGRNFHPRVTFAGMPPDLAVESEVGRLRSASESDGSGDQPPVPVLNPDYHRGASEGLSLPFLRGDEPVALGYMDPDRPQFEFRLPGAPNGVFLDVGNGPEWMEPVLQDVVVFKGADRLAMIWRGSCRYDGPESMAAWTRVETGVGS
jgi:hypothetical protein